MKNLKKIFKDYIIKLDNSDIAIIDDRFGRYYDEGFTDIETFKSFLKYLDCTRVCDGNRITQTINKGYHRDISMSIYMIENIINESDREDCIKLLEDIHNRNLEFEKINPPIVYEKKKPKKNTSKVDSTKKRKTYKQKELFEDTSKVFTKKIFSNSNITIGI